VLAVALCLATAGCGSGFGGQPMPVVMPPEAKPAEAFLLELRDTMPYPKSLAGKDVQKSLIEMGRAACAALGRGVPEAELHEVTDFEFEPVIPAAIGHFCPGEA
jgi:hypothetical protein